MMDKENTVYVQALWTVADSFKYSVSISGFQSRSFKVFVMHSHKSFEDFLGIGRATIKAWCQRNMHQWPADGETLDIEWETLVESSGLR
ncbi:MAG: hypothetical protein WAK20_18440 [Candidatus Acidiferrum sp.]